MGISTTSAENTPLRIRIRQALDGQGITGRITVVTLYLATIIAALLFMFETVDSLQLSYGPVFVYGELALASLFTVEYLMRLFAARRPLAYMFSFWGIVDLLSSLPVLLTFSSGAAAARTLRLFRLARMLKLLRIGDAYERILSAFKTVSLEFLVFFSFAGVLLYFASIGIYFFERDAQPDAFTSAPASLWWAVVTLTTVGYGDVYPVTAGGRIFTGVLLLIGLSIIAIPTGLFSSALIDARREQKEREQEAG